MLKFFRNPFAITGTRAAVPDADPSTGEVNYETGYPAQYQLPKADPNSRNIERDKMNQVLFDATNAIAELQAHGTPDFIDAALNGGVAFSYGIGDCVRYDDGTNGPRLFESLVNANTQLPTVAANWRRLYPGSPVAQAAGTANALTATFVPSVLTPSNGQIFVIEHAAANTGAVTLAINGGAARNVVTASGLALMAGDIPGAGSWGIYVYDLSSDRFTLVNAPSDAFRGANQNLASPGHQKIPGGLTLQWGVGTLPAAGNPATIIFPFAFPTAVRFATATWASAPFSGGSSAKGSFAVDVNAASLVASPVDTTGIFSFFWLVIGH